MSLLSHSSAFPRRGPGLPSRGLHHRFLNEAPAPLVKRPLQATTDPEGVPGGTRGDEAPPARLGGV
jgi:hypothetical protein